MKNLWNLTRVFSTIMKVMSGLLDALLPPLCPLCGESVDKAKTLCYQCIDRIKRITPPMCRVCGLPFLSAHVVEHVCDLCMDRKNHFRMARSFGFYEETLLEALHNLKYGGKTALATPLAHLISLCDMEFSQYDVIVPVPLHRKRLRKRGFNQSLLLGMELGKLRSIDIDFVSLKKLKSSPSQVGLKRGERIRNIKGTFCIGTTINKIKGKRILLVDDVFTTGATVNECSKILKKAGAEFIDVLTVARVIMNG